jgi:hypothetical protein
LELVPGRPEALLNSDAREDPSAALLFSYLLINLTLKSPAYLPHWYHSFFPLYTDIMMRQACYEIILDLIGRPLTVIPETSPEMSKRLIVNLQIEFLV